MADNWSYLRERVRLSIKFLEKNHKTTAPQITAELNEYLQNPFSHFYRRTAFRKLLFSKKIFHNLKNGVRTTRISSSSIKNVIFSSNLLFYLFPSSSLVYICKQPKEAFKPDCFLPTIKHCEGSMMYLSAISWKYAEPITFIMEELTLETI